MDLSTREALVYSACHIEVGESLGWNGFISKRGDFFHLSPAFELQKGLS